MVLYGTVSPALGSPDNGDHVHGEISRTSSSILEDGKISESEYLLALDELLDCVESEGVAVSQQPARQIDGVNFDYAYGASDGESFDRAHEQFTACYLANFYIVDILYQTSPEVEETASANLKTIEQCTGHSREDIAQGKVDKKAVESCVEGLPRSADATFDQDLLHDLVDH